MGTQRIIADSCSYFRLAEKVHPFLQVIFGAERFCIIVCPELDAEYSRNARLKSKFAWVKNPQYAENRKNSLVVSVDEYKRVWDTRVFVADTAVDLGLATSQVDVMAISYGIELNAPIITDDLEMVVLAKAYNVKVYSTLQIMHTMVVSDHITMEKASGIVKSWVAKFDTPSDYRNECEKLFGSAFMKTLAA